MVLLPTLRQLQFFLALARRQSFSRAAQDCFVSQSTLSSAIKELEAILEIQLVDRSTRSFSLTPAGESVVRQASVVVANTEDLVLSVRNRALLSDSFKLGVIPTIAPFLLPALTPVLQEHYPALKLYLREDLTAHLVEQLAAGLVDAALLALPYEMPGMETVAVGHDDFWFACAPDHPLANVSAVSLEQLAEEALLLLEDGHCLRDHALAACRLSSVDHQTSRYAGTSLMTLAEMTRTGIGSTLLPDMAVRQGMARSAGLVVCPFVKPTPRRMIGVAWRKGSGRAEEAMALATTVRDVLSLTQKKPVEY